MKNETSILQIFNDSDVEVPLSKSQADLALDIISNQETAKFVLVELVYVDESEIVRINEEHLDRDYITDIISFRYDDGAESEDKSSIEGTLFCCVPRIFEQSKEFSEPAEREFKRIFIHGLLHLIGYEDDTKAKKEEMTNLENNYLRLLESNK
ncbi:rRNA maturation RNase YbeY [Gracilimonas halophila]|uniref:Endoribonuclease YbeY n=1 Tax=Gracilimonas halophila TaxID=1834464 RepID=A0ABW5JLA3_9BACT